MNDYRYSLQKYDDRNSRHICLNCNQKQFVRYIDKRTHEYVSPEVGRCNRESKYGYHYTPKQYFDDNNFIEVKTKPRAFSAPVSKPKVHSTISTGSFKASLKEYDSNNFILFLKNLFGIEITTRLIEKDYIGTSDHWHGATVFWQIDSTER